MHSPSLHWKPSHPGNESEHQINQMRKDIYCKDAVDKLLISCARSPIKSFDKCFLGSTPICSKLYWNTALRKNVETNFNKKKNNNKTKNKQTNKQTPRSVLLQFSLQLNHGTIQSYKGMFKSDIALPLHAKGPLCPSVVLGQYYRQHLWPVTRDLQRRRIPVHESRSLFSKEYDIYHSCPTCPVQRLSRSPLPAPRLCLLFIVHVSYIALTLAAFCSRSY